MTTLTRAKKILKKQRPEPLQFKFQYLDGERMRKKFPKSFYIPEFEEKKNLNIGDYAYIAIHNKKEKILGERFWVKIIDITDQKGRTRYVGELEEDLYMYPLDRGYKFEFYPKHVLNIATQKEMEYATYLFHHESPAVALRWLLQLV